MFWLDALELLAGSGAQEVFGTLVRFKGRQFTIRELARESGVPFSSVWRLVGRFERAGVVERGKLGSAAVVRLKDSAYSRRLTRLIMLSVSPQAFAVDALKTQLHDDKCVKSAYVFGSVARGEEKPESDVDLAILASKGFDPTGLVFKILDERGIKVVPLVFHDASELSAFLSGKKTVKLV